MWFKQKIKQDDKQYYAKNLERTLNRLYICRDLEISNLWQRSIFLGAFLILCFTGYGVMFIKFTDAENWSNPILNIGIFTLSIIGWIISVIWIFMAKGSKAWYEVYETYITKFENEYYEKEYLDIPDNYIMGENICSHAPIDKNLFTTNAGAFSVSKINILIGQICVILWSCLLIIHGTILGYLLLINNCILNGCLLIHILIALIINILFLFTINKCILMYLKKKIKSGVLTKAMQAQEP